ncbi:alpha/beta fold hydrolase [Maribellus maritimus]|uniref:alpha/beta fold hydrolase n=1 Tax=Maribellus maritimus TaxID=2870838 RepID=UPI001EECB691|nr:alpha/beta hydrolase [Maribellus maritimus]MCG6186205.1 alpha/beta hydrolase [Maribellus maritimus]
MNTFFSNPEAKEENQKLYHQKLDELPIRYEFMQIETSYGDTNIVITGPKGEQPLVLLHDSNSCAPAAIETMIDLTQNFRIYAVDIPGQPNLSEEFRLNMNDNSYGKWMYEILSRLGVKNAFLVGISFGGFVVWQTLIFEEKRIAKAFLISPSGIIKGNPLKIFFKVFRPVKRYKKQKKIKYLEQFSGEQFSEKRDFAETFLSNLFLHYTMDFSPIPLISKNKAQRIKTPIHIFTAENDLLFPGKKIIKRAKKIFTQSNEFVLLKNSKHVLSGTNNVYISKYILNKR